MTKKSARIWEVGPVNLLRAEMALFNRAKEAYEAAHDVKTGAYNEEHFIRAMLMAACKNYLAPVDRLSGKAGTDRKELEAWLAIQEMNGGYGKGPE